ncbi:DUF1540 domain-containing protein [Metasolibacillus meyeri]|uniref:DUF1540 domain-containing protein n=1 Tax=Metasolibacillus meyeri TaxID=1071052 RepID=A0AAW9NRT2_9BACL|nr:DUF1540 domain-containing protein [Metasolibacillus meyeri]MEC1178059.1 DUF1540 domain-containing protein [Metasolibacillus meyeri]
MPQVEVNCTVSNCFFHAEGDLCSAERIQVDMNHRENQTEFAGDFDFQNAREQARHSFETCCKTFKPKNV